MKDAAQVGRSTLDQAGLDDLPRTLEVAGALQIDASVHRCVRSAQILGRLSCRDGTVGAGAFEKAGHARREFGQLAPRCVQCRQVLRLIGQQIALLVGRGVREKLDNAGCGDPCLGEGSTHAQCVDRVAVRDFVDEQARDRRDDDRGQRKPHLPEPMDRIRRRRGARRPNLVARGHEETLAQTIVTHGAAPTVPCIEACDPPAQSRGGRG
ncbi:MAG: hypothetical protein ABIN08_06620 [Caldimonas sp.]